MFDWLGKPVPFGVLIVALFIAYQFFSAIAKVLDKLEERVSGLEEEVDNRQTKLDEYDDEWGPDPSEWKR
jgi:vacuolar-type H+-ATPase subunit I/STV1